MKLKERPNDFRVLEVLRDGLSHAGGEFRVYRVTKSKLTTIEAADRIAKEAGVEKRNVAFAGLKDRQGVTVQFMSVHGGRRIQIQEPNLKVEHELDTDREISSDWVRGNSFDIVVRQLHKEDVGYFKKARDIVKEQGVPNYFDDQRFGSIRHGQGFVVREMIDGNLESALKRCLLFPSPFDPPREAAFKGRLRRAWGEFEQCVSLCRGGKHLSVFEHLARKPTDFAGAFRYVSQRLRLIHLYTYQSYLWNRAVSEYLKMWIPAEDRLPLHTDAGTVLAYSQLRPDAIARLSLKTFPLLAPDVKIVDPDIRKAVDVVMDEESLTLSKLVVRGVEGFAFKAEERAIVVTPRHLRAVAPEDDELNARFYKVRLRFELPRGSYATLVIKRLFATATIAEGGESEEEEGTAQPTRRPRDDNEPRRPPRGAVTPRGRSTIRESGDIPGSVRGELKLIKNPGGSPFGKDRRGDRRGGSRDGGPGRPDRKPRERDTPDRDTAERDAEGKLTFSPPPKGGGSGADAGPRAFGKRPYTKKPFNRDADRGGPGRFDGPDRKRGPGRTGGPRPPFRGDDSGFKPRKPFGRPGGRPGGRPMGGPRRRDGE